MDKMKGRGKHTSAESSAVETKAAYRKIFEFYLDPGNASRRIGVKRAVYGPNLSFRIWSAGVSLLGNLWRTVQSYRTEQKAWDGKIWVVVGSRNQENSLAFLTKKPAFHLIAANAYQAQREAQRVPWWHRPKIYYLLKYLPTLWEVKQHSLKNFTYVFHHLIHGVGCFENHVITLRKSRPKAIVIANEDLPFFRALILAARRSNIPTVYLQHAAVSADFPSLLSDLALLDGQDSLDKYQANGKSINSDVHLIGSPKYDDYSDQVNTSTSLTTLGIPYGFYDLPEKVVKLAAQLSAAIPELRITIRKHPRDQRPMPPDAENLDVAWSDSRKESPFEFLARQDAIIASDSAIHLEAVLMNVSSFYYPLLSENEKVVDIYGFVKNKLVPVCTTQAALLDSLSRIQRERPAVRHKAAYYIGNIGTPYDGRSQEVAFKAIQEFLADY